jgi:hypothetical protein
MMSIHQVDDERATRERDETSDERHDIRRVAHERKIMLMTRVSLSAQMELFTNGSRGVIVCRDVFGS